MYQSRNMYLMKCILLHSTIVFVVSLPCFSKHIQKLLSIFVITGGSKYKHASVTGISNTSHFSIDVSRKTHRIKSSPLRLFLLEHWLWTVPAPAPLVGALLPSFDLQLPAVSFSTSLCPLLPSSTSFSSSSATSSLLLRSSVSAAPCVTYGGESTFLKQEP